MRTTIDIPDDLHEELKVASARQKCTVTAIVLRAIRAELSKVPKKGKS